MAANSNFRRAVQKVANDALKKRGAEIQRVFDRVHRSHAGQPVEVVKTALRSACRRADLTPNGAQLESWAQAIHEGRRIKLDIKDVRL